MHQNTKMAQKCYNIFSSYSDYQDNNNDDDI